MIKSLTWRILALSHACKTTKAESCLSLPHTIKSSWDERKPKASYKTQHNENKRETESRQREWKKEQLKWREARYYIISYNTLESHGRMNWQKQSKKHKGERRERRQEKCIRSTSVHSKRESSRCGRESASATRAMRRHVRRRFSCRFDGSDTECRSSL